MNMGAGRVVYQDLTRIDKSIARRRVLREPGAGRRWIAARGDGTRCTSRPACPTAASTATSGTCTRSSRWPRAASVGQRLRPRDHRRPRHARRPAASATSRELEAVMRAPATGRVATVIGRYYAMDRDKRWERTQARLRRDGQRRRPSAGDQRAAAAIEQSYAAARSPTSSSSRSSSSTPTASRSGRFATATRSIFFNFRADRARQITRAHRRSTTSTASSAPDRAARSLHDA